MRTRLASRAQLKKFDDGAVGDIRDSRISSKVVHTFEISELRLLANTVDEQRALQKFDDGALSDIRDSRI